jgi:hypothetical protein
MAIGTLKIFRATGPVFEEAPPRVAESADSYLFLSVPISQTLFLFHSIAFFGSD